MPFVLKVAHKVAKFHVAAELGYLGTLVASESFGSAVAHALHPVAAGGLFFVVAVAAVAHVTAGEV